MTAKAPGAVFSPASANRKLSPIGVLPGESRPRFKPLGPFVATTSVSIGSTCPLSCPWLGGACYASSGFTKFVGSRLDKEARNLDPVEVMENEASLISSAGSTNDGRPLRLHVAGEVSCQRGAQILAEAVAGWNGPAWTFSHRWATVKREAWGRTSVLGSIEDPRDAKTVMKQGYAVACVFEELPGPKAFKMGGVTWVPCPYEAHPSKPTCVQCGLCFNADRLRDSKRGIAFAVHGPAARQASR